MRKEKRCDFREIGKFDDFAKGVFVEPSFSNRDEDIDLMKQFIASKKLARDKKNV